MALKPIGLSVKALLLDDRDCCLILQRSVHSRFHPGVWDLPGGKCDGGESVPQALQRETREETGLLIEPQRLVGCCHWELPHVTVACLFLEARVAGGQLRLSDEHEGHRWVPRTELPQAGLCPEFAPVLRDYARQASP